VIKINYHIRLFHRPDWPPGHAHSPLPTSPSPSAREVFARLCASLPPPPEDTPEARVVRGDLAYAAVESYYPVDTREGTHRSSRPTPMRWTPSGSPAYRGSRRMSSAAVVPRGIR